jgi:hypothetical protein
VAIAYLGSAIGTAMTAVAIAFVAYNKTGSVALTALVFSGNTLPFIAFAPISSRLFTGDLRIVLAADQAAKAAVWGGVAVLAGTGQVSFVVLLAANFAFGSLTALSTAGWPRLLELLAPPGRLPDLTALFKTIPATAAIVGALAGGAVLLALGRTWVFAVDAASYVPVIVTLLALPPLARLPRHVHGQVRAAIRYVTRTGALRRAFLLSGVLNLAAFPVLSALPAIAHEIDARGHVLGILQAAFFAGAALVVWAVVRLRRRLSYSRILFVAFLASGLLLVANAVLTAWRDPGIDAVLVAGLTLLPIGLAITVNASLLQALVVLECPDEEKASVLALYGATVAGALTVGGVLLGVAIDSTSIWPALGGAGVVLALVAVALRQRIGVFDALESANEDKRVERRISEHWHLHLRYLSGADIAPLRPPHDFK